MIPLSIGICYEQYRAREDLLTNKKYNHLVYKSFNSKTSLISERGLDEYTLRKNIEAFLEKNHFPCNKEGQTIEVSNDGINKSQYYFYISIDKSESIQRNTPIAYNMVVVNPEKITFDIFPDSFLNRSLIFREDIGDQIKKIAEDESASMISFFSNACSLGVSGTPSFSIALQGSQYRNNILVIDDEVLKISTHYKNGIAKIKESSQVDIVESANLAEFMVRRWPRNMYNICLIDMRLEDKLRSTNEDGASLIFWYKLFMYSVMLFGNKSVSEALEKMVVARGVKIRNKREGIIELTKECISESAQKMQNNYIQDEMKLSLDTEQAISIRKSLQLRFSNIKIPIVISGDDDKEVSDKIAHYWGVEIIYRDPSYHEKDCRISSQAIMIYDFMEVRRTTKAKLAELREVLKQKRLGSIIFLVNKNSITETRILNFFKDCVYVDWSK